MEVSEEASLGLPIHLAGRNEDTDKGEFGKRPRPRTNSLVGNPGTKKGDVQGKYDASVV